MILRLRRTHRRAMTAASLLAAAGLAAAVAAHPGRPAPSSVPEPIAALLRPPLGEGARLAAEAPIWHTPPTTARLYVAGPDQPALLELQPLEPAGGGQVSEEPSGQPAVLVYWSPVGDTLEQAWLLGTAPSRSPRRYPLPEAARAGGGRLLLWSLGHHELLAAGSLPAALAPPGGTPLEPASQPAGEPPAEPAEPPR